jgi:hypothetical protein
MDSSFEEFVNDAYYAEARLACDAGRPGQHSETVMKLPRETRRIQSKEVDEISYTIVRTDDRYFGETVNVVVDLKECTLKTVDLIIKVKSGLLSDLAKILVSGRYLTK